MTRYLLDTNVISELRKNRPHGAVVAWFEDLRVEQIFISAVTMGELQTGVERARRQDPAKAQEIEAWLSSVELAYACVAMDSACFREWSRLVARTPNGPSEDAMIAATARVHGFTVATRNEKDFRQMGVPLFNPFRS